MDKNSPFPITDENFAECWSYVDKTRRTARKKAKLNRTAGFFSGLVFMLILLYSVHGLIYSYLSGPYREFIAWIPHFSDSWQMSVEKLTLDFTLPWYQNIQPLLLCAYAAAFVVFLAFALIILVLYHPFKKKLPTEATQQEKASQLAQLANRAYWSARQIKASANMSVLVLLYIFVGVLACVFIFYLGDATKAMELLTIGFSTDYGLNIILIAMACCLILSPFEFLRSWITYPLVRFQVPYTFVSDVERYAALIGTSENTNAEKIREEALELESFSAYARAKELLLKAACLGDPKAMEHYARHCLIAKNNPAARYWLEQCVATGQASEKAQKKLKRMKWHLKHKERYINR